MILHYPLYFRASHKNLIKLNSGLHLAARALSLANRVDDSIEASYAILIQFGETLPCAIEDEKLRIQIDQMDLPGDTICNLQENNEKRMTTLLSLYSHLAHIAHYHQPRLVGSLSLRMVEITMKTGLSAMSPLAFAYFGGVLVKVGRISEGCRLGKSFRIYFVLNEVPSPDTLFIYEPENRKTSIHIG